MIGDLMADGEVASAPAVGVGVWVFFGWCWLGAHSEHRAVVAAGFGLVVAAAFGFGWLGGMVMANPGFSSLAAMAGAASAMAVIDGFTAGRSRWMVDLLVCGGLAGLAVARLGCLLEGCDFGRPFDGSWAVEHPAGSRAWSVHVHEYGLATGAERSLSVHPFGAYLAGWGMACAAVGEVLRRLKIAPGVPAMVAAGLFLVGGGVVEWFREPATVVQIADGVSAYPAVYWAFAAAVVAGGLVVRRRETK